MSPYKCPLMFWCEMMDCDSFMPEETICFQVVIVLAGIPTSASAVRYHAVSLPYDSGVEIDCKNSPVLITSWQGRKKRGQKGRCNSVTNGRPSNWGVIQYARSRRHSFNSLWADDMKDGPHRNITSHPSGGAFYLTVARLA